MKKTAQLFKALSDETRLRILALLSRGERCVCELMAALDLPQSTVSRHLSYLKNAGWIDDRRQGVWMYYRFAPPAGPLQESLLSLLEAELVKLPEAQKDLEGLEKFMGGQQEQSLGNCR